MSAKGLVAIVVLVVAYAHEATLTATPTAGTAPAAAPAAPGAMAPQAVACDLSRAGFSGAEIPQFLAIARAESGLNPQAWDSVPVDGYHATGLLQVVDYPSRTSRWALRDPQQNAQAARSIYLDQGIGAWSTWPSPASGMVPWAQGQLAGWTPASC